MKFLLFVEGHTEKKALPGFLKRWLDIQLRNPVGIDTVRFEGWPEFRKNISRKARLHLDGPNQDKILAVISLMDLYGPTFYPERTTTWKERCEWAKKDIETEVNHPNFFQFFAVHETEAWLLSDPSIFPSAIRPELLKKGTQPENVNFDEPPAKLLERLYNERLHQKYKKIVHGTQLFNKLDPDIAREKCPHLKDMLDTMLRLARENETTTLN